MKRSVTKSKKAGRGRSTKKPDVAAQLRSKIASHAAHVGIVGLGYVGLPLAAEFARAGFRVTGIDVDERKVAAINDGVSYVGDVPSGELARLGQEGLLRATTDYGEIARLDTVNICVPTPLRKTKDPGHILYSGGGRTNSEASPSGPDGDPGEHDVSGHDGGIDPPRLTETGLAPGRDFFLCFSPERVDPGNQRFTTRNIPKVVGGVTPVCAELGALFYRQVIETVVTVPRPRSPKWSSCLKTPSARSTSGWRMKWLCCAT